MAMTIQPIPVAIAAPSYQIETITPEYAERVLADNNVGNRPYRRGKVLELVHIIRSGQWIPTSNDAICFAPDGTLINGQHRLMAIVAAKVAVQSLVGRNIPHEAYRGMDRGTIRTFSDTVYSMGIANYNEVASTSRKTIRWAKVLNVAGVSAQDVSLSGESRKITVYEIEAFVKQYPFVCNAVSMSLKCKGILPVSTLATWVFVQHYNQKDMDMVAQFVDSMNVLTGDIMQSACPAVVIGRQLIRYKTERRKVDEESVWASLDIAFNEFSKGQTRHRGYVLSKVVK